jgi:hypothetical protein
VPGALILVLVMVLVGPFLLFAGGAAWSALVGTALDTSAREASETSPSRN